MSGLKKIHISPTKNFSLSPGELFGYRDLLLILAQRDLRVRYAQTFLGLLWAVIQPLLTLGIFIIIFSRGLHVDTNGIPYAVFALSGMLAWTYFAFVFSQAGQSLIGAQDMIKKVYFPRILIPLSKSLTGLVEFAISGFLLIGLLVYYEIPITSKLLYFPLFLILNICFSLAAGIWTSSLSVRFRDFQHVIPFVVQLGMYATPIAYPSSLIPEKYQWIYHLNPMASIVEGFRWSLLGTEMQLPYLWISVFMIVAVLIGALLYFRRVDRVMADLI